MCVGACVLVHNLALQYGDSVKRRKAREEEGHPKYGVCEATRSVSV